jgi:predicted hotdog family 3-hydroxylacyl-ACP dehydratase
MMIDKAQIRRLIPHAGSMCLLDEVAAWDATFIECVTMTHQDPANPLRRQGRLAALHAFEYGAQAAAIHGELLLKDTAQGALPTRYLAALKNACLYVLYLDIINEPLEVTARWLTGNQEGVIYQVRISAEAMLLAQARIFIMTPQEQLL